MTSHVASPEPGAPQKPFDKAQLLKLILAAIVGAVSALGVEAADEPQPVQVVCPPCRQGVTIDAGAR